MVLTAPSQFGFQFKTVPVEMRMAARLFLLLLPMLEKLPPTKRVSPARNNDRTSPP
jgi:hypothetical protein